MNTSLPLSQYRHAKKIFFDVSGLIYHLKKSLAYSGIQRVVANIISEFAHFYCEDQVFLSFVGSDGTIRCVRLRDLGEKTLLSAFHMRSSLYDDGDSNFVHWTLRKYLGNKPKYFYHRTRLDVAERLGLGKAFHKRGISLEAWRDARRKGSGQRQSFFALAQPLSKFARPGDQLVILDSSWNSKFIGPFAAMREAGLEVCSLIHDLIPLRAPETVSSSLTIEFCRYLLGTLSYTDRYLANSDHTRTDLLDFFEKIGVSQRVETLRLAQIGLGSAMPAFSVDVLDEIKHVFSCYPDALQLQSISSNVRAATVAPFVLCVGTIEMRKNNWRLAMAWRRMFDNGIRDLPRLVFAGRPGSMSEPFFDLMRGTGHIDGLVSIVDTPSDAELDYMYRRCQFFAMPSLFEGWGLPVGEGLAYGKTGIVSRATSLPEVGGDLVLYCDPHSVESIVEAAKQLISSQERRTAFEMRVATANLRSWTDVASDLVEKLNGKL